MTHQPNELRYENMVYNRSGKTGLKLPAISVGLWHNFGGNDSYENARDIVLRAFDLGITHFDLANNYGPPPGSAEKTFGEILKSDLSSYRDELIISSKAGYDMWPGPYGDGGSRKYMLSSLDQSLKRLGLDYVDIYYSHRPDPDTPMEETMLALDTAVRQGKALYVGISNYSAEQTVEALNILRELKTPIALHQPSYSMFNRWIEEGLLDVVGEYGIGTICFSPLAQGLLSGRYLDGVPEGSRAAGKSIFLNKADINEQKLSVIRKLNDLAQERGQTLSQLALAWVLRDQRVTSALVGVSSVDQLEQNVKTVENLKLSEEELALIEKVLSE